jgi:hypothetical protein
MYHHTMGVFLAEKIFGKTLSIPKRTEGEIQVPVRLIAERHIIEDLGWLPSPKDYIDQMPVQTWMSGSRRRELPLSHLLGAQQ